MHTRTLLTLTLVCGLLAGCSIHESGSGKNKDVDIKTPIGSLAVRTTKVDIKDVGLSPYPGATEVNDHEHGDSDKANVSLNFPGMGLKVVALKFHSDDPADKVLAFYKNDLKKFGDILECEGKSVSVAGFDHHDKDSDALSCGEHQRTLNTATVGDGGGIELKAGTKPRQHIVHVEKDGSGSKFELVYVEANDKHQTM